MIMQGLTKLTKRAFFIMLVLIIVPLQTLAEDRFGLDKAAQGTSLNRQPIEVVAANMQMLGTRGQATTSSAEAPVSEKVEADDEIPF